MHDEVQVCRRETMLHKGLVLNYIEQIIDQLTIRQDEHDNSKLESPEVEIFAEYGPKLKDSTYGSDAYNTFLKEMRVALGHHYANNRHHPEHFNEGVKGMTLVDLVEMFCDWYAASQRHDDGDIHRSIDYNKNRFNMSDDLTQILMNTVEVIKCTKNT